MEFFARLRELGSSYVVVVVRWGLRSKFLVSRRRSSWSRGRLKFSVSRRRSSGLRRRLTVAGFLFSRFGVCVSFFFFFSVGLVSGYELGCGRFAGRSERERCESEFFVF